MYDMTKLISIASVIGLKFNIVNLMTVGDIPAADYPVLVKDPEFCRTFRETAPFDYEFVDPAGKDRTLKSLTVEFIENIRQKHNEISVSNVISRFLNLYQSEPQQFVRDDILSIIFKLSRYLYEQKLYGKALESLSFILSRMYRNQKDYEDALYLKAQIHFRMKEFPKMTETLNLITIFPEIILKKYKLLIEFYFETGDRNRAEEIFTAWDKMIPAMNLHKIIDFEMSRSDYDYRLSNYDRNLERLKALEESAIPKLLEDGTSYSQYVVAQFNNAIGIVLYEKEEFQNSLNYLLKAADLFQKTGFKRDNLSVYNNIAEIYKYYKKYDKAVTIYQMIINNAKAMGDKESLAIGVWNVGETYFFTGDYPKAEEQFNEAERIFFEANAFDRYDNYLKVFFAKLYLATNRAQLASEYVDEVLLSAFEKGQTKYYADALVLKGVLLGKKGEDAVPYFDEALSIYGKLGLANEIKETEHYKVVYFKR